jgi:hypothetical protein
MLRRDAQESNSNKQTNFSSISISKVRGGESDAKFYEESGCECGCVLAGFAGVAQSLNVDDRAGSVYVANEYVHDRVIKVPVRVAANAKCGQWWQAMTDAGWLRADIVKGLMQSCGVNPVVTLRRSIRKIRDYR